MTAIQDAALDAALRKAATELGCIIEDWSEEQEGAPPIDYRAVMLGVIAIRRIAADLEQLIVSVRGEGTT